jgi:small subunit ribosomal protein S6
VPTYETLFITPPNLSEDDEQAVLDAMAQVVSAGGGSFLANDRIGRRRLAYPIRKFEDGVYVRFLYDAQPDVPKELERRIRLSDNVLRSLTVVLEKEWAESARVEAKRDAERRAEAAAEAERQAAAAAAEAAAAPKPSESESAAVAPVEDPAPAAEADASVDTAEPETPAVDEAPAPDGPEKKE